MRKSKFSETQIVGILKDAEAGVPVNDLLRKHGVSRATFFKWRSKYGGASVSAVHPSFGATDCSTAHAEAWASRCSSTIRTARSRTSGENRLGRPIDPILLRNSWVHKFACFEVNEAQAESLCAVTEVAERPGAMLGLIGLDSRIGVVDVTS